METSNDIPGTNAIEQNGRHILKNYSGAALVRSSLQMPKLKTLQFDGSLLSNCRESAIQQEKQMLGRVSSGIPSVRDTKQTNPSEIGDIVTPRQNSLNAVQSYFGKERGDVKNKS